MRGKYPCLNATFIYGACKNGHLSKKIISRCRKCSKCLLYRKKKFIGQAYQRLNYAKLKNPSFLRKKISMWTLGTNWKDTVETWQPLDGKEKTVYPNRKRIIREFQKWKSEIRVPTRISPRFHHI